jgi:hypothetical protein
MGKKKKMAVVYAYDFAIREMRPMIEMEIASSQDILSQFVSQSLLVEEAKRSVKEEAEVLAQALKKTGESLKTGKEKGVAKTYSLTYYNPVTHKAEVIEKKIDIRVTDFVTRMIEESVGINSSAPLYTFVASPLIRTEVVPWKLKQILDEREYGTPPEFGGAAKAKVSDEKKSEIVAIKKEDEAAREAVVEAIVRKEESEKKLSAEIVIFEETIKAIREGKGIKRPLSKLPPLSKARYKVALEKKNLSKEEIIDLLLQDVKFLKNLKKKLATLTIDGLLNLVKAMKKLG